MAIKSNIASILSPVMIYTRADYEKFWTSYHWDNTSAFVNATDIDLGQYMGVRDVDDEDWKSSDYYTNTYNFMFDGNVNLQTVCNFSPIAEGYAYTFRNCRNLTYVSDIPNNAVYLTGTFTGCNNLVNSPNIPNSVKYLISTFQNCTNLVNGFTLPTNCINAWRCFEGCTNLDLSTITIPNTGCFLGIFHKTTFTQNDFETQLNLTGTNNLSGLFAGTTLTGFNIPDHINDLSYTFQNCNSLTDTPVIPNSVTTLAGTFMNCVNLVNVSSIPNSVINMANTFSGCTALNIAPTIPNSVMNMYGTFANCYQLVQTGGIPESVRDISNCFYNCMNIVTVSTIPNSIVSMTNAFYHCANLTTIPGIPKTVRYIAGAFNGCKNLDGSGFVIPKLVNDISYLFSNTATTSLAIPNWIDNLAGTFSYCKNLTDMPDIPNSVTNMRAAFSYCSNLVNIKAFPNHVVDLSSVFLNCTNLTGTIPDIPDSVINMGYAFQNCANLYGNIIGFPNAVINIANAFTGSGINSVNVIFDRSFSNISGCFCRCNNLTNATLTVAVNNVDLNRVFAGCANLHDVNINITVANCSLANVCYTSNNITNVNIQADYVSSLYYMFGYGSFTSDANINLSGINTAGVMNYAFAYSNIKNVYSNYFPNHVSGFYGAQYVFLNCKQLTDVYGYCNGASSLFSWFSNCIQLVNVAPIPNHIVNLSSTFYNCYHLVNAPEIPDSVTAMEYTFSGCNTLVNIPRFSNSVVSMVNTFYNCRCLVTVPQIPNTVINMQSTFMNCTNLTGDIFICSNQIATATNCFKNTGTAKVKDVYIPFTYQNGEASATYNAFTLAGYDEIGTTEGVYLKDINRSSPINLTVVAKIWGARVFPENATINGNPVSENDVLTVNSGDSCTITLTHTTNYHELSIFIDDVLVESGYSSITYTFTPTNDCVIGLARCIEKS